MCVACHDWSSTTISGTQMDTDTTKLGPDTYWDLSGVFHSVTIVMSDVTLSLEWTLTRDWKVNIFMLQVLLVECGHCPQTSLWLSVSKMFLGDRFLVFILIFDLWTTLWECITGKVASGVLIWRRETVHGGHAARAVKVIEVRSLLKGIVIFICFSVWLFWNSVWHAQSIPNSELRVLGT